MKLNAIKYNIMEVIRESNLELENLALKLLNLEMCMKGNFDFYVPSKTIYLHKLKDALKSKQLNFLFCLGITDQTSGQRLMSVRFYFGLLSD